MINQELAKIFYEIATRLEVDNVPFKPQAYEKAALELEALSEDVREIYEQGGIKTLEELPGVGKSIAEKIVEYLKTGKIREYQQLKKKMPVDIEKLMAVEGVGPKTISILYKVLGIKNLKDLERAAKAEKIRKLENFGEKSEQNILESIEFLKRSKGRFLLGEILPIVQKIISRLKNLKEVKKISEAGSVRRRKETIGDVDILAVSPNPKKVIDYFISLSGVIKVWAKGPTKTSVFINLKGYDPVRSSQSKISADPAKRDRTSNGVNVDLRVLPENQFGSALQYFTGSKEHNIATRKIAMDRGLKLNEYGVFRGPKMIAGRTEEEVYKAIGLAYIEPELRENQGEIEAALKDSLPKIIGYKDIKGDLHCHSHWGMGIDKGKEMIEKYVGMAKQMGYEYIGISDHTKFLAIEHGLNERQLLEQNKFIKKLNSELRVTRYGLRILHGCEANIMADGSIDIKDEVLAKLDYVIVGAHSQFKMSKEKMTERIIRAMKNPNVDIISHLTGRIIHQRDEYEIDFDKILKIAKETGTVLEINAYPVRLDLKDINIRKAKEAGVKMVINTDSHQPEQMRFMEYGVSQARRGWAEKKDIINCWSAEKMLRMIK